MKLPSINYLITSAKNSLIRFPLTILCSLLSAMVAIYLVEYGKSDSKMLPYINVMLCASIGIPLFFCTTIISNKKGFSKKNSGIINLIAASILVGIFFTLPNATSTHNTSLPYIKYAIYNITCHLLVSFVPFAFSRQLNAFWHYNKILFIRLLASILYSAFIFIGLAIALTSLKLLFDIDIHSELYFEIWIVLISIFNTWFFVSGIPEDFDPLEQIYEYPKGLKTFSQFVLLPLLALYLIILYTYGTKILSLWDWPKGIVSYLIICVSVLGILTFLLLHPYGNQDGNSWIKKSSKGYYFMLFPLLIILFIAIFMRVGDYGITINRYVILFLGVWLSIVFLYTAFGKTNIKFIPSSLACLLIIVSFGPWGMFSFSEKSQVNRLKNILETAGILENNKVKNETYWIKDSIPNLYSDNEFENQSKLNDSLASEVKSILEYLDSHHGFSFIKEWYKQNLDSIINLQSPEKENYYNYSEAELYMKTLGLKYEVFYEDNIEPRLTFNATNTGSVKKISGYDYFVPFEKYTFEEGNTIFSFNADSIEYKLEHVNKPTVKLLLKTKAETITFEIEDLANKLRKEFGNEPDSLLPISKMQLNYSNANSDYKIEFHSIELVIQKNNLKLANISGDIFIKRKP
ncbi:MAG: DUF4153 domain-containing protein [Bacteroidia bacterium]|nr:DUF4153 domain-containing protein [Bacteroidia bacterium]